MKRERYIFTRRDVTCALAGTAAAVGTTRLAEAADRPDRLVLWSAGLRNKPVLERLRVAAENGFTHISLFPIDFKELLDSGQSHDQIKRAVRDSGVGIVACDPYTKWVPDWQMPEGYPDDYKAFVDFDEAFIFHMAESLEVVSVNCVEPFGVTYETAALTDALGAFAERARGQGLRVVHEFMPISGIPDLKTAWAFIEPLPADQVGLNFDTWHFYRSDPDLDLLRSIPSGRIVEVQLADALSAIQGGDLVTDLLGYRLLPGEGDFDLATVIDVLRDKGALRSVGPEIFSFALDGMNADEVGVASQDAMRRWMLM